MHRPRSLALSGRAADGTILSELSTLAYIGWAREQIAATRPHRLTVLAWVGVDADGAAARAAVVGTPERCAAAIRALGEAGADSVVLVTPAPDADVGALADQLLPLLRG